MPRGALIAFALLAALAHPAASDSGTPELQVFVNAGAGVTRLSASELAEIYNGSRRSWAVGRPIVAFNLTSSDPLRVEYDRVILHMSPDEVGRYWVDQRVRSGARPPRQVEDGAVVARLVAKLSGGIGYAAAGEALSTDVRVVARIRNHNVVEP